MSIVNSMLAFLADKVKNTGTYINADQSDVHLPMGQNKSYSLDIPEDGTYVVTVTNSWGADIASAFSILYLEYDGEIVGFSRNTMRAGGGQSVTAIIKAAKGTAVQANMSWHGGSGNCTAEDIKFRATRIGGGHKLKRLVSYFRKEVRR